MRAAFDLAVAASAIALLANLLLADRALADRAPANRLLADRALADRVLADSGTERSGAANTGVVGRPRRDATFRFRIQAGAQSFRAGGLRDAYGWVPRVGAGLLAPIDPVLSLSLEGSVAWREGDPYDDPTFEADGTTSLTLVPVAAGVRFQTDPGPGLKWVFGLDALAVWYRERRPGSPFGGPESVVRSGVVPGLRLGTGPEWHPKSRRFAVGLEFLLEGTSDEDLAIGRNRRHVQHFSSVSTRLTYSRAF